MADSQKEGLEGLPVCEKMVTITEYAQSSPSNRKKVGVSRRKSVKICLLEIKAYSGLKDRECLYSVTQNRTGVQNTTRLFYEAE